MQPRLWGYTVSLPKNILMGLWLMGRAFLKSYMGVCLQGAVIVLACIVFSAFAASGTVVLGGGSVVAQVWGYLGEVIFNMLVLVGLVKGADRVVREMFGM